MSKLPREFKDCVVVRSQHNVDSGDLTYEYGLKACSVLIAILLAWRIVWPLISMVVVNQWLVCLALLVFIAIVYLPFYWLFNWMAGHPFKEPQKKNNPLKQLVHHWVITERSIKRYYANYFQCLSMNSVKSCEVKDQHLQVTYHNCQVDKLPLDGFSNETQLRAARVMLSNGLTGKPDTLEPLKNSIEIESSYSKEAVKTFNAHCPVARNIKTGFYRRSVGIAVCYLLFTVLEAFANGNPVFSFKLLMATLMCALPEVLTYWLTDGNAQATRHFWRIDLEGFRFGYWTGGAYLETCRKWGDLQEVVETREGLLLKFAFPMHSAFLPRDTISLMDWNECTEAIRMLSEKEFVVVDRTPALEPMMVGCRECDRPNEPSYRRQTVDCITGDYANGKWQSVVE